MSEREFQKRLEAQGWLCAACGREFGDETPRVDHDHSCCPGTSSCGNCVRGLIHALCNTAMGMMLDCPDVAQAIADYLKRSKRELDLTAKGASCVIND